MVRFPLFLKTLRDDRRGIYWWSAGLLLMGAMWMSLFPSVRSSAGQMSQYLEKMPAALRAMFVGRGAIDLSTANGYLKMEAFSFMLPLLLTIFAVGAAARTIAGEEERGTLEVLLANPMSRSRVVRQKLAAIVLSTIAVAAVFDASVFIVGAVGHAGVVHGHVLEATAAAVLVGLAFGMAALAIGCSRGRKGLSIGVASGIAVVMYLVETLSSVVPSLAGPSRASLFYYYLRHDPLMHGIGGIDLLVIAAVAAACAFVAQYTFNRRDLAL